MTDPSRACRVILSCADVLVARPDPPMPDGVRSGTITLERDGAELHSARFDVDQLRRIALMVQFLADQIEVPPCDSTP